jgi:hypothetical protein
MGMWRMIPPIQKGANKIKKKKRTKNDEIVDAFNKSTEVETKCFELDQVHLELQKKHAGAILVNGIKTESMSKLRNYRNSLMDRQLQLKRQLVDAVGGDRKQAKKHLQLYIEKKATKTNFELGDSSDEHDEPDSQESLMEYIFDVKKQIKSIDTEIFDIEKNTGDENTVNGTIEG